MGLLILLILGSLGLYIGFQILKVFWYAIVWLSYP